MKSLNHSLIISGIALLLFGIIVAIMSQEIISYILGGLGLFLVVVGCFVKEENKNYRK